MIQLQSPCSLSALTVTNVGWSQILIEIPHNMEYKNQIHLADTRIVPLHLVIYNVTQPWTITVEFYIHLHHFNWGGISINNIYLLATTHLLLKEFQVPVQSCVDIWSSWYLDFDLSRYSDRYTRTRNIPYGQSSAKLLVIMSSCHPVIP